MASMILPLASLFFFANFWGIPEKVELDVSHYVSPSDTFGDEDVTIKIRVSNNAAKRLGNLEINDYLPDKIELQQGMNHFMVRLDGHEEVELQLQFHSPTRGHYEIGPLVVQARDPFGFYLFERQSKTEILSVMPRPQRIRGAELRPVHIGAWPGQIHARIRGPGTEFYSIRNYVPGDDPKRINWKASARHGALFVNEMEAERVTDVMVVLDTDVSFYEQEEAELFERGVTAAASMASLLLKQGNRVGVILQGEERGVLPPGFGKRHERNILYLLAAAKPGRASLSTSYVMTLLAHLMLPAMAQLVVISPLLDTTISQGIRELSATGYSTLVVSPSPPQSVRFESQQEEIAYRVLMLERSNTVLALEKLCTVVQWPADVPLSTVLRDVRRPRLTIRV